ncbi:mitochondrial substrate carrier family protein [Heterostelium album PN500]|uniref:Mitochondrial substrate carrier family protein n=1 Tax=Heterostelium pallidum (strain ATCC 26659 / Pp 5 / PN500) TaxID=670386 RepID=D3BFJ2_HETP5|nr:mitochondrial substrate carrier family protein [Heterostelium album PN500]EFA79906.1 mitochondrial substrate carrier family protein [Heterostelium album PN500]|eukprot:XP_020432027.1 mitochondrial substrate carrier family protein [Heterostelium album PN500]
MISIENKQVREKVRDFIGGAFSGVACTLAGHPFDTLKVRLQTEGTTGRFKGMTHCLTTTIKEEGILALYKGATPPMVGMSIINSCMFGTLAIVKKKIHPDTTTPITLPEIMVSGAITGWAVSFVATPIETVKSKLQVQYSGTKLYSGPIDCIQKVVRQEGIQGLYRALIPTGFQRNSLWAYFGGYELANRYLKREDGTMTVGRSFLAGGVAGTGFWCTNFPFDVIRSRIMTMPNDKVTGKPIYSGMIDCAKKIYAVDGWRGFWKGFTPCLLRTFPANGATFVAYEFVMKMIPAA